MLKPYTLLRVTIYFGVNFEIVRYYLDTIYVWFEGLLLQMSYGDK